MGAGADGRANDERAGISCCGVVLGKKTDEDGAPGDDSRARLQEMLTAVAAEWGSALPLVQVWLPKQREGSRGGLWLSVDGAPFVMSDSALQPLRNRSTELCFCRGQGLPGRVWATGASEVIQDHNFVSQQHYSHRSLCLSEGLLETIGMPVYVRAQPGSAAKPSAEPIGVLEIVLASSQQAVNGSALAIEGRMRLSMGGTAAVMSSVCRALDNAGLSCSSDVSHHGYSTQPPAQVAPPASPKCEGTGASWRTTGGTVQDSADEGSHRSSCTGGTPRHSVSLSRISSCRSLHLAPAAARS